MANPETQALPCGSCGQQALAGANFCHNCGKELPAPEGGEIKLLTCEGCQNPLSPQANYCPQCGEEAAPPPEVEGDFSKRTACSDGMCLGVIGPDGKCSECGKPYSGPPQD